jgi:copper homeostasis protein
MPLVAPARKILLEVIATTLADAQCAERAGADRLELITAFGEGGLTPSIGIIEAVVDAVTIPVNVIVRPHSRSFVYDTQDQAAMLRDVGAIAHARAHGVVIGMLNAAGDIDRDALARAVDAARGLAVTFHRAFDEVRDQRDALDVLLQFDAVTNVLTSGGKASVLQAQQRVRELVAQAQGSHCTVLAGAGLTVEGIGEFVDATGVSAVHFGSGVRIGGDGLAPIDEGKVARVRAALDALR